MRNLRYFRAGLLVGGLSLLGISGCGQDGATFSFPGGGFPTSATATSDWVDFGPRPASFAGSTGRISGRVASLLALDDHSILLGSASGGAWRTEDNGGHWQPVTDSLDQPGSYCIGALTRSGSTIYAGTGEINGVGLYGTGVLRSRDDGRSFELLQGSVAPFRGAAISKVLVDPQDPQHLLVASGRVHETPPSQMVGLFASHNGGADWSNTLSAGVGPEEEEADEERPTDAVSPHRAYDLIEAGGAFYASVQNEQPDTGKLTRIYRSPDGDAWNTTAGAGFPANAGRVSLASGNDGRIYALAGDQEGNEFLGLYISTDGAASWRRVGVNLGPLNPQSDYGNAISVDPEDPGKVYLAGFDIVRVDVSDPATGAGVLTQLARGFDSARANEPHVDHHALTFQGSSLLNGNDGGIWRLDNPGLAALNPPGKFVNLNSDLETVQFNAVALHPTDPYLAIGGTQDNSTLFLEHNIVWNQYFTGDGGRPLIDPLHPQRFFTSFQYSPPSPEGTSEEEGNGSNEFLLRTVDGSAAGLQSAVSGIDLTLPGQFYAPLAMHPRQPQFVAFSNSRVYETTRNDADGVQWGEVGRPFGDDDFGGAIAYAPANSEVLYVASVRGDLFVRTQRGGPFELRKNGLPPTGASALAVADGDPEGRLVFATVPRFDGRSVFVSRDQGRNWENISGNLPQVAVRSLALDGSDVYVGGDAGVFHLTVAGWEKVGQHLPPTQVHDLQIGQHPHRLAAGTHGRGMWVIPLNGEPLAAPF